MSKRGDTTRVYNISVVGLSGTERDKGQIGCGKSCLCNRFIRPKADDYYPEHISVLSVTDFSGRVVNNDHFLYWGYVTKNLDDSPEIGFHIIEQTEFIDDATFQPFKGGKMEPYVKRCASTRLYSAEKLMYICKSQLGIEKEFEQKIIPDGRLNIDGFIVVFDVSSVPGRSIERQTEFTSNILYNILRTKKPLILVTTKNDEQCEAYIKEAEKLLNRKEFKNYTIPIVETSSHENINIDISFLLLSQLIDKIKSKLIKINNYQDMSKQRKDMLDNVSDSFQNLIQINILEHCTIWIGCYRDLIRYPAFQRYIELFGEDCAQRLFRRHIKHLKDEFLARKERKYLEKLPLILQTLFPDLPELQPWSNVIEMIREHDDCNNYFITSTPSGLKNETDWKVWGGGSESSNESNIENRIPFDLLNTGEGETVWLNTLNNLQLHRKLIDNRLKFKILLNNTPYVTAGKKLSELQVLFMGHDCFESLKGYEINTIYEQHQIELIQIAKLSFLELMLEKDYLFIKNENNKSEIIIGLSDDIRYKALDRLDDERKLMIIEHLEFIKCPNICPSGDACVDGVVEQLIKTAPKIQYLNNITNDALLTLYLIGSEKTVEAIRYGLSLLTEDDEYELDGIVYTIEITNKIPIKFPINNLQHLQLRLFIYSNMETLEECKINLENTLLINLAEEHNIPFIEPHVIIILISDEIIINENLILDGKILADNLGCTFFNISCGNGDLSTQLLAESLQTIVRTVRDRTIIPRSTIGLNLNGIEPDIRIIMCMFCGDNYPIINLIQPLFTLPACQQTGEKSISLLTFLGERRRGVQLLLTSYHTANKHHDQLIHGLILVYLTTRLASFSALKTFSENVPNLPIQILAVTEYGGAATMFTSNTSQKLITDGNLLADELNGHFTTWSGQHTIGIYTNFFRNVWEMKNDIEKAFRMESPTNKNEEIYEQLSDDSNSSISALLPTTIQQRTLLLQKRQQQQQQTKLFATNSRSTFYTPTVTTVGKEIKKKNGRELPGKLNITEYTAVTDAVQRMHINKEQNYCNIDEYIDRVAIVTSGGGSSTTTVGNRKKLRKGRITVVAPSSETSSESCSDGGGGGINDEKLMRKKKGKKKLGSGKCIFAPIPTVPKGFIPYQITQQLKNIGNSGIISEHTAGTSTIIATPGLDESPIEQKQFTTDKKKIEKRKKEKLKKLIKSKSSDSPTITLEEAISPHGILERCIKFIELEGLEMEGLYRVPGNRSHVDTLFQKLAENSNIDLKILDIPVNAVATALKDFLAKRLPPSIPTEKMVDIERVSTIQDRSLRLLELKKFLYQLPIYNLQVLRLIFQHLVRVSEKSRINSMDSKNLAICWWPTLLPFSFIDMLRFEQMRPFLEDLVQTMIDQFPFLFCGKDDVVMV